MKRIFTVALAVLSIVTWAQNSKPQWVQFTTNDGLPDSLVNSIAVDSKENYWAGTGTGLAKFDGKKWVTVSNVAKFKNRNIFELKFAKNGILWIGTCNDGLLKFKDSILANYSKKDGLSYNFVTVISIDKNEEKWMGTYDGISRFDDKNISSYTKANADAIGLVHDIDIDEENNKWFALESGGVLKFDGINWTRFTTNNGLVNNSVYTLAIDHKGVKWFGTRNGLSRFDGTTWTNYTSANGLLNNFIFSISVDKSGQIWFLSESGLSKFDGNNWTSYKTSKIATNSSNCLTIDARNNKWIATDNGIFVFNENGVDLDSPLPTASPKISGTVYLDENQDATYNANESYLRNQKVLLMPDSLLTFTNNKGEFQFTVDSQKTYRVKIIPQSPYSKGTGLTEISVKATKDTVLNTIGLWGKDSLGFSSIMSSGVHRCGKIMPLYYTYKNTGTKKTNATIVINIDKKISIANAVPQADSIGKDNRMFWKNTNFEASENKQIQLQLSIPAGTMDTMKYSATVAYNNTKSGDSVTLPTRCSYDPNDLQVSPEGIEKEKYTLKGKSLSYTVHFQNTGNDTAYDIKLIDTLDVNLDWSTLSVGASSHTVRTEISPKGVLVLYFDNIMLPHSSKNEILSNGFINFSIKPKASIAENTEIKNTVHIVFDQNPAIVTNTTLNTLVSKYPCSIYKLNATKEITNCDAVTINGETFTQTGTYTQKLSSKNGCDSILTLNVKIIKRSTASKSIIAFKQCTFGKHTFCQSATLDTTLTNILGCDSLVKLTVTITTLAGDADGNNVIDGKEIAGDANGDATIDANEKQLYLTNIEDKHTNFNISPNPVNSEMIITLSEEQTATKIKIVNTLGQIMYLDQTSNFGQTVRIDMKSINTGIYTVQILINGEWLSKQIIKE